MPRSCEPETCGTLHPCSRCGVAQECRQYYRRKNITPQGRDRRGERTTMCKTCATAARVAWRKANPERVAGGLRLWKYNLTAEQYEAMLRAQGGLCRLCERPPSGRGGLHVDHDHRCCPGAKSCGKCVRGLLCSTCNAGLGSLQDNPTLLRKAAQYVEDQVQ